MLNSPALPYKVCSPDLSHLKFTRAHFCRWCEVAYPVNLAALSRVLRRQLVCSHQWYKSLLPFLVCWNTDFCCEKSAVWIGEEAFLLVERQVFISQKVWAMLSSLLPKDAVVFVRAFGSLTLGQLGHSLHVFMADSNWVKRCPAYLFFLGLVFFWIRGWDQLLKTCGGAAEVKCPSR